MEQPRASIIIPLLNQVDAWLEQAVLSALKQTVPCEVLVITSPRTLPANLHLLERLRQRHPNLKVLCRRPETAFPGALNLGIRTATTDRIGFLMSDDWLDANAVEICLGYDTDIVSTNRTFYLADGKTVIREFAQAHTPQAYLTLARNVDKASFIEHFLLLKQDALNRVGGVDESLGVSPGVDDFDMIWCLLELGASVSIVSQPLYHYRDHEGERLTRYKRDEMLATFNRILDKHGLSGNERERVLRDHTPWFGTSMWVQYQRISPQRDPGQWVRWLQRLYRSLLPFRVRLLLHKRLRNLMPE